MTASVTTPIVVASGCLAVAAFACIEPPATSVEGEGSIAHAEQRWSLPGGDVPLQLEFKDGMSSAFVLEDALFEMDGRTVYRWDGAPGSLARRRELQVFTGSLSAGDHVVRTKLDYRGEGYGRGYRFAIKSSHAFTLAAGGWLHLTMTAFEEGTASTPLEQRPRVDWHEMTRPGTDAGLAEVPSIPEARDGGARAARPAAPNRSLEAGANIAL